VEQKEEKIHARHPEYGEWAWCGAHWSYGRVGEAREVNCRSCKKLMWDARQKPIKKA